MSPENNTPKYEASVFDRRFFGRVAFAAIASTLDLIDSELTAQQQQINHVNSEVRKSLALAENQLKEFEKLGISGEMPDAASWSPDQK